MKTFSTKGKLLALIALAVVSTVAFSQPAHADRDDHGRGYGDWHGHRGHGHREWHEGWHGHPGYYGDPGPVVYSPAPVIYAPPPPSPGINLVVPLHFH